jgi:pSer/pThr/pTyr-binding forkhead associated (FHA) protein
MNTDESPKNLALLADPHTGQEYNLCRFTTSIGRSIAGDIVLSDNSVSRQHAVVYCLQGKFYLEDVGSTNGTMVNGQPLTGRTHLNSGDEIRFGISKLLFLLIPDRSAQTKVFISQKPTTPLEEQPAGLPLARQGIV